MGKHTGDHPVLPGGKKRGIEIRLVVEFLYCLSDLLRTLAGDLSPVVQDTVDRAFGDTCLLGHIENCYLLLFHNDLAMSQRYEFIP